IKRGWLGVKIQVVTKDIAESLGLEAEKGALVAEVTPEGPADKGGIKTGDIILEFDNNEINGMRELPRVVADHSVDEKVNIVVLREGKKKTLSVKLGELKDEKAGPKKMTSSDENAAIKGAEKML